MDDLRGEVSRLFDEAFFTAAAWFYVDEQPIDPEELHELLVEIFED